MYVQICILSIWIGEWKLIFFCIIIKSHYNFEELFRKVDKFKGFIDKKKYVKIVEAEGLFNRQGDGYYEIFRHHKYDLSISTNNEILLSFNMSEMKKGVV